MNLLTYRILSGIDRGGAPDTIEEIAETERLAEAGQVDFIEGARPSYGGRAIVGGRAVTLWGRWRLTQDGEEALAAARAEDDAMDAARGRD